MAIQNRNNTSSAAAEDSFEKQVVYKFAVNFEE